MSVTVVAESRSHVPSRASSAHQVEYLARLHGREAPLLTFVIQSCHEALQDVECRQASDAAAVKRQQTEAGFIDRVWLSTAVLSQRLRHRRDRCEDERLVSRRSRAYAGDDRRLSPWWVMAEAAAASCFCSAHALSG
jgi:hypothetical protein